MEELLAALFQFIIEFLLNVVADIPFDWPSRNRRTPEPERIAAVCFLWLLLGATLAWLSLFFFPRPLISRQALRMANLVLAPFASGLLSLFVARRRALTNPYIIPRNHFWQAFWFSVGLVAVRFAYAGHP
jgi:hypothetical protein